jgi:hypothetical protein
LATARRHFVTVVRDELRRREVSLSATTNIEIVEG